MSLRSFIARRYLFAKKSHNVINIISLISGIGIAGGSCALVVVLSVYNGFESIVRGMYDKASPDYVVLPAKGKSFVPEASAMESFSALARVSEVVSDHVFARYADQQSLALLCGVDSSYAPAGGVLREGEWKLRHGEIAQAVTGRRLSRKLRLSPRFLTPLVLYYPDRGSSFSISSPTSSLSSQKCFPAGVMDLGQNTDDDVVFTDLAFARSLLGFQEGEVSKLELFAPDASGVTALGRQLKKTFPAEDFIIKDKYAQNETVYKMMRYEKIIIFGILLFIILVVACNVYGSLTMLIIEKRGDIAILRSMGASEALVGSIFTLEGMMITLLGLVSGMLLGLLLCLLQQKFGIIGMPGDFLVQSYPVVVRSFDLIISFAGVLLIGIFITFFPTKSTLKKML